MSRVRFEYTRPRREFGRPCAFTDVPALVLHALPSEYGGLNVTPELPLC